MTPRPDPAYKIAFVLGFAIAFVLGGLPLALNLARNEPGDALGPLALTILYAQPAALAAHAFGRRHTALLAAAVMSLPLAFTSFAFVTAILLVPAGMYLSAYNKWSGEPPAIFPGITAVLAFILGGFTFALILIHEDPACVTTATSTSCSSDTITAVEVVWVAAAAVATHGILWAMSAPRRGGNQSEAAA